MSQTYLLDQFLYKKSLERERLRLATIDKVRQILKQMSEIIFFREAYLFGSITQPHRFFEKSDIDIAFVGLKDEDFFPALVYLSRSLKRDVDIVQLEKHRLREKIIKEGILLWTRQGFPFSSPK